MVSSNLYTHRIIYTVCLKYVLEWETRISEKILTHPFQPIKLPIKLVLKLSKLEYEKKREREKRLSDN